MTLREELERILLNGYDEEFGVPEKYTPKDRPVEQLSQIINNDVIGEALSDYKEAQRDFNSAAATDFYNQHKQFLAQAISRIEKLIAERYVSKEEMEMAIKSVEKFIPDEKEGK